MNWILFRDQKPGIGQKIIVRVIGSSTPFYETVYENGAEYLPDICWIPCPNEPEPSYRWEDKEFSSLCYKGSQLLGSVLAEPDHDRDRLIWTPQLDGIPCFLSYLTREDAKVRSEAKLRKKHII